ncbi:MAG: glycosyltransferase family 4 protein [Solirubrobacterales bacterium]
MIAQTPKAVIIYLAAGNERPNEDLIRLLREMASNGYRCFLFLSSKACELELREPNLIIVDHESPLIPALRPVSAIVLTTRDIHPDWADFMYHKLLWLHIDESSPAACRNNAEANADIITYYPPAVKIADSYSPDRSKLALRQAGETSANLSLLEDKIRSLPKGWQPYANLDLRGKVAVMAATFLDFSGEFYYSGGAERYLLDLAEICHDLKHELVVFQYGNYPWLRRVKNTLIVSLGRCGIKAEGWVLKCAKQFNLIFHEQVQGIASLGIYSAFYEAWPRAVCPNIGISHGVSWDNPYNHFENAAEFWVMNQRYIEGAKACEELVSVDTNTANWFQTVDYQLGQRINVIPNYVDLSVFKPPADYLDQKAKTVILYPRQLYSARGLYLVLEVMDEILERYPEVEFHFVGRGGEEDVGQVMNKQSKWPGRVKCYCLSLDQMPRAYQAADIALIPSLHSEGASLSCLEAMACGNAVIATRIGGLPDLIIDNFNGLLINPRPEELAGALVQLLENRDQLVLFKQRSHAVAQAFSKERWRDCWVSLLNEKMDRSVSCECAETRVVEIILGEKPVDLGRLGEYVLTRLAEGCLVYIRTASDPSPDLSFARIQWIGPAAPIHSPCDETVVWEEGGE